MDHFLKVLYRSPVWNNFCVMSRFVECSEWIIFIVLSRLGWMLPMLKAHSILEQSFRLGKQGRT